MIDQAWNVLSERDADILKLREQRVPLREIAEKYEVSIGRVRQISVNAKRKLRDAQQQILRTEANQILIPTEFRRGDLLLINKALRVLQEQRAGSVTHTLSNMRDVFDNDPLYCKAEDLREMIEELLKNTSDDVQSYIEEARKRDGYTSTSVKK